MSVHIMLLLLSGTSPACPHVIVGKHVQFCVSRVSRPRDVLRFLADRGYPLAVLVAWKGDTVQVDEGPFIHVDSVAVLPSNPWMERWVRSILVGRPFAYRRIQPLLTWLTYREHAPSLVWAGTVPVLRWSVPPPRGMLSLRWDRRLFGGGDFRMFLPTLWMYVRVAVEGYRERQILEVALQHPLRPRMDLMFRGQYTDARIPQARLEGGGVLTFRRGEISLALEGTGDTIWRAGLSMRGIFLLPHDTLRFWGILRRGGWMLRVGAHGRGKFLEGEVLLQDGSLRGPDVEIPRGGWRALHGWPDAGFWTRGGFFRIGVGPPNLRGVVEGLWEADGPPLWSAGVRWSTGMYSLWGMHGIPGGRTWVYVTLRLE